METKKRKVGESGESPSDVATDDVRVLLDPLSKEQLLDILQDAAIDHEDVLERIRELADKDVSQRKLFVHGLNWETTSDTLKAAFSTYGEIDDCVAVTDRVTGKGKGYGFVVFKHIDGAHRALKEPSKKIDGRKCFCQFASAEPAPVQQQFSQNTSTDARKIYVARVPPSLSADKLHAFFSKYGEIEEGPLGFDKETGKSKGYAIFIYKSEDSVLRALDEPFKTVEGHQMTVKRAEPKYKTPVEVPLTGLGTSALTGLLPFNHGLLGQQSSLTAQDILSGLNPGVNLSSYPSVGSSIAQQLAVNPSLGTSLTSLLNPSLVPSLSASLNGTLTQTGLAHGQIPLVTGNSLHGISGLEVHGSQLAGLGGAPMLDSSLYGLSASARGGFLPGSGTSTVAGTHLQSLLSYYPR